MLQLKAVSFNKEYRVLKGGHWVRVQLEFTNGQVINLDVPCDRYGFFHHLAWQDVLLKYATSLGMGEPPLAPLMPVEG